MALESLLHDLLVFAGGSLFGLIIGLVVAYVAIKYVLARIVAVVLKFGIAAVGGVLPSGVVGFLGSIVKAAEATSAISPLKRK